MIGNFLLDYLNHGKFLHQLLISLTVLISIYVIQFVVNRRRAHSILKKYGIPGPQPSLIGGNFDLIKNPRTKLQVFDELRKKYGKIFGLYEGAKAVITITDLELIKKIFHEDHEAFDRRFGVIFDGPITNSLLFTTYSKWRLMRKSMAPAFSNYALRGVQSTQFVEDSVGKLIEYLDRKFDEKQVGEKKMKISIHKLMKATALYTLSNLAIKLPDVKVREDDLNVAGLDSFMGNLDYNKLIHWATKLPVLANILGPLANHFNFDKFLALVHKSINDNIDKILATLDGSSEDEKTNSNVMLNLVKHFAGGRLSRAEVVNNANAVLMAGYDTTSATLCYTFWAIAKYPEIQERLREDVITHGVDSKYLDQVLNESMRLYPAVASFITRMSSHKDVVIGDVTIPKNCPVSFNGWLVHRDPTVWKDPHHFDPERFREGVEYHPASFAPFGFGKRKCVAFQLALVEMKMIYCDVLIRYKLTLVSPLNLELISFANALTAPRDHVVLEFERLN